MRYRGKDFDMHDAWFLNVDGVLHAFHLRNYHPDAVHTEWPIGHIVSRDLLHFEALPDILPALLDPKNPMDFGGKFTGCCYTDPKDGSHLIYYTMRDNQRTSQRFGACRTYDMEHFDLCPENPVLEPDCGLLIGYDNIGRIDWNIVDCRDLVVVKNPKDGLFYGYFAAAADVGRQSPVGVIAVAVSDDLVHWRDQSIVYVPRQNGVIEVPDVFFLDGKWILTALSGSHYAGRSIVSDPYVHKCTIYATADSPRGPFVEGEHNILIGGIENSGYTCRTFLFEGKRYLMYVDGSYGGNTLSLPKEIGMRDGKLCALYAPIVSKLHVRQTSWPERPETPELLPTSFAWRTFGGRVETVASGYQIETNPMDYQGMLLPEKVGGLELNFVQTIDAVAAGCMIGVYDANGWLKHPCFFAIEPERQRILLAKGFGFEYVSAREYPFQQGQAISVRLIMTEGVCEVYIDDVLLLQCGIDTGDSMRYGFFCDRGRAGCKNVEAYELES